MHTRLFGSVIFLLVFFVNQGIYAQLLHQSIAGSGGYSQGSGGSISYTAGQVSYMTHPGSGGSLAHGVQQPYEISLITGIEEAGEFSLSLNVYPKLSDGILILTINTSDPVNTVKGFYHLLDMHGRILLTGKINSTETEISMNYLSPAIYFLKVTDDQRDIRVFKIIKN